MRKTTLEKFKRMLLKEKENLLFNDKVVREDFLVNSDDRYDEIDQAATDSEQAMRMRLRNREVLNIKKIDQALARIEEGTFGICVECEEEIDVKRLEVRLQTTHCSFCKEEQERKEVHTAAGREHKSMGESFSRKYA